MRQPLRLATVVLLVLAMSALLPRATAVGAAFSVVVSDELNIRSAPTTAAAIIGRLHAGDVVTVAASVDGREVLRNNVTWFRLPSGGYIYSAYTTGGDGTTASTDGIAGRWVEVDRSAQVARAMQNGRVVYTAPVTIGTPAFPTPVGRFRIFGRVLNETMDSRTIGIPLGAPGGYFLRNVLYTQYFVDGVSLHYNYWSPPEAFGNYPGSHGCVGLMLEDARFFWNFADIGTPVIVVN